MKKIPLVVGIVTLAVIIGGVFIFSKNTDKQTLPFPPSTYEYFWGDGCPHCKNVQAFYDSWDKKDQVKINKMEVWNNNANAKIFQDRASSCGIKPKEMGVPFLVTPEGKCLSGDVDIINLLKSI